MDPANCNSKRYKLSLLQKQLPVHKELLLTNHVLIFMFSAFLKGIGYLIFRHREAVNIVPKDKYIVLYFSH